MSAALVLHLKKYLKTHGVNSLNINDIDIDSVVSALKSSHPAYKLEKNQVEFRASVLETLTSLLNQTSNTSNTATQVLSLNQSMINQYKHASKRQRPVEVDLTDEQEQTQEPVQEALNDGETASVNETPRKVIKKPNKKRQVGDGRDAIEPDMKMHQKPFLSFLSPRPATRLSNLAGLEPVLKQIQELVFYPVKYPALYQQLGVTPPCGILLHGPSGCGKTTLACAIAGELGLPFFKASGPELVGGTSGESEERIRQIFDAAATSAPSVLFIDALDVIAGKKESSNRGMDRRIVAQLFDSIDYVSNLGNQKDQKKVEEEPAASADETENKPTNNIVVLIVATNKPDNIDPGVRGRFSREIALPVPDAPSRAKILQLMTAHMTLSPSVDFTALGKATPGFVGADLQALAREAGMIAVSRIVGGSRRGRSGSVASVSSVTNGELVDGTQQQQVLQVSLTGCVEMSDFMTAAKSIQPTAKREGFAVAPNVTWSDVGALSEVREELLHNVLEPIAHPERFRSLGLEVPAGVLFFGPPGCGKTLLAKALANQSGANFISVKGPELLNMYVGESESRVRQVFARARASAPCVIFFDELDALCPKRGGPDGDGGGNNVSERVVNQLLTELDGLETRRDVYIIAATNRLELIDDAMLRPGRLGKLLYVPLPSVTDRVSILTALTRKISVKLLSDGHEGGVDLEKIGSDPRCEGFSGADLAALVREAGLAVVREVMDNTAAKAAASATCDSAVAVSDAAESNGVEAAQESKVEGEETAMDVFDAIEEPQVEDEYANLSITAVHFESAFNKVKASVTEWDRARYQMVQENIKAGMGAIQALKEAADKVMKLKRNKST